MILTELVCPFPSAINPSAEIIYQGTHDYGATAAAELL